MAGPSKTIRIARITAIAILSLFLPTGAIWFGSDACASVMFFVAVFLYQGQQGTMTVSLRKLIIQAALMETVRDNISVFAPGVLMSPICRFG